MNPVYYTVLGLLIGLLGVWVTQSIGWIQIEIAGREHGLNLAKTVPKIGTTVSLEDRKSSTHPVSTLVIITTIYNEADSAASQLKGNWQLTCSQSVLNRSLAISREYLGKSLPYQIETEFGGVGTWRSVRAEKNITIYVYIEFRYDSLPEEGEQAYKAHYRYDYSQNDFVRQS